MSVTTPPARVTPGSDLDAVLGRATEEAARLLHADGAILYLLDPRTDDLRWAHDAGISSASERAWMRSLRLPVGKGIFGTAMAEGRVARTDDYLADPAFPHAPDTDRVARDVAIRSMIAAPLLADGRAFGALGVYSSRAAAFDEAHARLIRALAGHAAAAMANAELIDELGRSRSELARRAEAERTLREITARITTLADPSEVLQRVVDESARLLRADGAHLSLMADAGTHLTPAVVAERVDEEIASSLRRLEFSVGHGIDGLAALLGHLVWTQDQLSDPRLSQTSDERTLTQRRGVRAVAAAPLLGAHRRVIGTLAVWYREPTDIDDEQRDLLQGLADHAAVAVANSRLYGELRRSEERYRFLLAHSPDLVWSTDADGRFTFLSETLEEMTGWRPEELLGKPFTTLVHPDASHLTADAWTVLRTSSFEERRFRFNLRHRDGSPVLVDCRALPIVSDGQFQGAHGSARDVSDQERLEVDLRRQAAELAAAHERAKLARELHDSVTQALFGMTLTTRSVELLLDRDPDAALTKLAELRELERDALAEMRALIVELRPSSLAEEGLAGALRGHAAAIQARTSLPVRVEAPLADRFPTEIETALFRIAQEALHNVVRHAGATDTRIRLERADGVIRLSVEDDGRGFDPAEGGRLGLPGMRSRAEQVGGRLTVWSAPGRGSRIVAEIPIPRDR